MMVIKRNTWYHRVWRSTFFTVLGQLPLLTNHHFFGVYPPQIPFMITLCSYTWRIVFAWVFWIRFVMLTLLWIVALIISSPVYLFFTWRNKRMDAKEAAEDAKEAAEKKAFVDNWLAQHPEDSEGIAGLAYYTDRLNRRIRWIEAKKNASPGLIEVAWETLKAWKEKHCPILKIED